MMPRHAFCDHIETVECGACDQETYGMSTAAPGAEFDPGSLWFTVYRHGGAHRADPVSLHKFPPAFAAFVATLEWDEEPALVADELDLPRHLFAR